MDLILQLPLLKKMKHNKISFLMEGGSPIIFFMTKRKLEEENTSSKMKSVLIEIPHDVFSVVVPFLDTKSLFNFQQCSKSFYKEVEENKNINWKNIISAHHKTNKNNRLVPYSRFFKGNFLTLEEDFDKTEAQFTIHSLRDYLFANKLLDFKFDLPVDTMGGGEAMNQPFIAFPIKHLDDYKLITEESAELKKDTSMYEESFKIESEEGLSVFDTFRVELENYFSGMEDEFKKWLEKSNKGKTAEYIEKLKLAKEMFEAYEMEEVYYQKAHYYWDDEEYNQGEMILYGVTKQHNIVGFSWTIYHNV